MSRVQSTFVSMVLFTRQPNWEELRLAKESSEILMQYPVMMSSETRVYKRMKTGIPAYLKRFKLCHAWCFNAIYGLLEFIFIRLDNIVNSSLSPFIKTVSAHSWLLLKNMGWMVPICFKIKVKAHRQSWVHSRNPTSLPNLPPHPPKSQSATVGLLESILGRSCISPSFSFPFVCFSAVIISSGLMLGVEQREQEYGNPIFHSSGATIGLSQAWTD